jgi:hypothetical protein
VDSEAALDYPRQIKAARMCGSAVILLGAAFSLKSAWSISKFQNIIESIVGGGLDPLPALAKFLFKYQLPLMGAIALTAMVLVWPLWTARRLSTLIYLITFGILFYSLLTEFIEWAMFQPWIQVLTKFQG